MSYFSKYATHYSTILKLGIPLLLGQFGVIVTSYVDTIMVGNYNTAALASASFVNSVMGFVMMLSMGFSYGLTPLVGSLYSSNDIRSLGQIVRNGFFVNVAYVGICCLFLGVLYLNLHNIGLPEHLVPVIKPYFALLTLSMLPMAAVNALRQFTDAINNTKVSMTILVGGNLLNIVLNYMLIYGKCGMPELGLTGAGIATLVARVAMLAGYVGYIFFKPDYRHYRQSIAQSTISSSKMMHIIRTSLPISIQMGMETATFTMASVFAGWLGANSMAAVQVLSTIGQLGFMVYYSLGAATSIKMSNFMGLGNTQKIKEVSHAGYVITLVSAVLASVIFLFAGEGMARLFTNDEAVVALVVSQIIPLILYQFGDATQIAFANSLRGIAHVKPIIGCAFVSYILIGIPAMYVFCFPLECGIYGIYMSHFVSLLTAGALFYRQFSKKMRSLCQE